MPLSRHPVFLLDLDRDLEPGRLVRIALWLAARGGGVILVSEIVSFAYASEAARDAALDAVRGRFGWTVASPRVCPGARSIQGRRPRPTESWA